MTAAITTTTADPRACPFVGPRPFRHGEDLFGRDRDVNRLRDLLIAERIVLLFSPSGAGKTSLVQAGLIPGLATRSRACATGFYDLPIVRVKQPLPAAGEGPQRGATNRFIRATLTSLQGPRPDRPGVRTRRAHIRPPDSATSMR